MGTLFIYWREVVSRAFRAPSGDKLGPTKSEWAAFNRSLRRTPVQPLG